MPRRRRLLAAALAVAATAIVVTAMPAGAGPREDFERRRTDPPHTVDLGGSLGHRWTGIPSYVTGDTVYSRGELIIDDRPFDDTGADTTPGNGNAFVGGLLAAGLPLCGPGTAYRNGDFSYPSDPAYGKNAADIVEVRIAADADAYYVTFLLETLIDPTKTVVGLGIDADHDPATGRPGWSRFEHVLQITGASADLDGTAVEHATDVAANTFEARIPRSALPGGTWETAAAAGTWDGSKWGAVVDLAYVPGEILAGTPDCWNDALQSKLIARGDYPSFPVDTDRLRRRESPAPVVRRGVMVRLYAPRLDLGEGTIGQARYSQTSSANVYRGKVQPYTVYVPSSYDPAKPNPLILLLHCLSCNHNIFHIAAWPGLKQLAESRGAPIVTPLAYGEGGHYEAEAEIDVFEVLTDVFARYRLDPERIYLTGMSMGSLGTFRLGELYPDLWARALGVGVYTTPFCVTPSPKNGQCSVAPFNYFFDLENLRNVPFGIINGGLDELTPVTGAREIADRFAELKYPYRYWEYPARMHEPALHGLTTDVSDPWFGDARRVTDPSHVTYVIERSMRNEPMGLVYDRAYWLRDLQLADGVNRGTVDAVSGRGTSIAVAPVTGSGTSAAGSYSMRGLDPTLSKAAGTNQLTLDLHGLATATVRATDAGLSTDEPLTLTVTSDRPARITVVGFEATLDVPAGTSTYTLAPTARSRAAGAPSRSLPATGGSSTAAVTGLALLVGVAVLRRRTA